MSRTTKFALINAVVSVAVLFFLMVVCPAWSRYQDREDARNKVKIFNIQSGVDK
jgi:hypothetical protein